MSHAKAYSFLSSTPKLPSKIILVPNCDHMNNLIFGNVRRKMDTSCLRPKQLAPPLRRLPIGWHYLLGGEENLSQSHNNGGGHSATTGSNGCLSSILEATKVSPTPLQC